MRKIYAILTLTLLCSASSYAIDQVTLTTGEVIQGKVLADVPNRHVDIQLVNGQKRRYPKSEVSNVERDVPSNLDRDMYASDRRIFFGPLAGGIVNTAGGDVKFGYGLKIGANVANLGGSQFATALAYKRYSQSSGVVSASTNFIDAQFLFRRISNSGFYIGPQAGLGIQTLDVGIGSDSSTAFIAGAVIGYDMQFSNEFSIAPEVQYDHSFDSGKANFVTFALTFLFHFE